MSEVTTILEREISKRLDSLFAFQNNPSINSAVIPTPRKWGGKGGLNIMSDKWHFFSPEEIKIIELVKDNPGLKQAEYCTKAEQLQSPINESTTKFILSNLVKRNVFSSSSQRGYTVVD